MKTIQSVLILCIAVFFLIGFSAPGSNASEKDRGLSFISEPAIIPLDKKGKVTLNGLGFKPGQEIRIIFEDKNGVKADIAEYLKPQPIADSTGKWSTVWKYGRLVKKKLIKKGSYTFILTGENYQALMTTQLNFQ